MIRFLASFLLILIPLTEIPMQAQVPEETSRWKKTGSPNTYLHHIEIRDDRGQVIVPGQENGRLPHLGSTCAPCHDVEKASGGLHGGDGNDGQPGEPWMLLDSRSGTRWPVHHRSWNSITSIDELGLKQSDLIKQFGAHDTGGANSISGMASDCLICHMPHSYNFELRAKSIKDNKPELASFIAMGLSDANGALNPRMFDAENKVSLDLKGDAGPEACLHCHQQTPANNDANRPTWTHADDVHLAAGMSCVDCHRAGLDHHIVRGHDGEIHPSGTLVETLSCRGCHLPEGTPVMHSAPRPEHRGLPPFHLEELTCTACHSGPMSENSGEQIWTSRAHRLGIARQDRTADSPPEVFTGILLKDDHGRWAPHYQTWPAGWVKSASETRPERVLPPHDLRTSLRRILRVRSDMVTELANTPEDPDRTERSISVFLGQKSESTAFISGGLGWKQAAGDQLTAVEMELAKSVEWKQGHPVRPASMSTGAQGCSDCHSTTANWPLLESEPKTHVDLNSLEAQKSAEKLNLEKTTVFDSLRWNLWKPLFNGRDLAKLILSGCAFIAFFGSLFRLFKSLDRRPS